MKTGIFIDNVVDRMEGKELTELPKDTTILFDNGTSKLYCSFKDGSVHIYKETTGLDHTVKITVHGSNIINVK